LAQAVAGPLLSCCTNSPLLFGHELWRETRIALFQQSVDTRAPGDSWREQEARVSFGRRWVDDSVLEIFQDDVTRFRVLMASEAEADPMEEIAAGRAPDLKALRVHNSTVYRWNRACYGITAPDKAHLRIENRLLPSGPTIADEVANAAFWFGLMVGVAEEHPDIAGEMEFRIAEENFLAAAQLGLGAKLTWPGVGEVAADRLLLDRLLPLARRALAGEGIDAGDVARAGWSIRSPACAPSPGGPRGWPLWWRRRRCARWVASRSTPGRWPTSARRARWATTSRASSRS
jgi:hypothetical protein